MKTPDQQMKYFYLIAYVCLACHPELPAQNNPVYKPFKVDIGFGMAIQQNGSTGREVKINPGYDSLTLHTVIFHYYIKNPPFNRELLTSRSSRDTIYFKFFSA
jgi:hypothetical protein